MSEERKDWTIGNLPTQGPYGLPLPDPEPRATVGEDGGGRGWNPSQTIGDLETLRPEDAGLMMLAGRYRAVKRLGEGGMGSVWLAEDTKLDNRKVAVKMLPAVLTGKKAACRQVKQEALLAMKLAHPNIATVRAFEEEDGNPFLVMDYIEGTGLDDILGEKGKLSEAETVKLLAPVAAALDYAHERGVVHRDVKPGNVMVDKNGTPFVLDFGIAREIQETMTRVTGKLSSGTLLYMSPEQLHGRAPKAAQDVYSFAAMAYECLSGNPPFARGQIEYQIDHDMPEPLEEGVASKALREGILSGLEKEPGHRPRSCAAVLANGGASRPGEPEKGTTTGTTEQQGRNGDVFLRKVRAKNALEEAGWADATAGEKAELERVREVFAAGEEAMKAGDREVAGELFAQVEKGLASWQAGLAARREAQTHAKDVARSMAGTTKSILLPGGVKMEMVWCPPGSFVMGSLADEDGRSNDETRYRVTLTEGFWMAKYAVTQEQWKSVMGGNPSYFKGDNLPVECVSWNACQAFCQKAGNGLRLPTEAEWEYACRAGSTGAYGGTGLLREMGWYGPTFFGHTHPMGEKQPNAWGLYDMHGNVWEWCEDWYGVYPRGEVKNPTGPAAGAYRVVRGGSWRDNARNCRSANRDWSLADYRNHNVGFRPVCSAGTIQ